MSARAAVIADRARHPNAPEGRAGALRGVTQPVTLDAAFNGGYTGHPMDPHARIGFSARGVLRRSEFGMTYGLPEPGSTMGVGDDVEIIIEAEFSGPAWQEAQ